MDIKNLSKNELLKVRDEIDSQLEYIDTVKEAVKKTSKKTKLSDLTKGDMIFCIVFRGSKIYNMDYVSIQFHKEDSEDYKGFTNFSTTHDKLPMGCSSCVSDEVMDNSFFLSDFTSSYKFFTMNPKSWKEDLNTELVRLIKEKEESHKMDVANTEKLIQDLINGGEVDRYIENNI